jgi:glycosyltransferase involved in cell wall biosynthesis
VAIDARGVSQMIENGVDGYLTPDDLAVFSQRVIDLLNAPAELRRLADGAERNAKKSFLNLAITKKLEILYNSLK